MTVRVRKQGESESDYLRFCVTDTGWLKDLAANKGALGTGAARPAPRTGGTPMLAFNNNGTPKEGITFQSMRHLMSDDIGLRRMDGVDYLVAPTILIFEGVWNNFLYTEDELAKFTQSWCGRPIVAANAGSDHPRDANGNPITANTPEIIEECEVGILLNVRWDETVKALKGESWIDVLKCKAKAPETLEAIHANKDIDVSTGLFTECDMVPGEFGDKAYAGTLRNYRPDHLALLPNATGACSWEDGAGLARNARGDGQGTGGAKQGDGGTGTCECPECGATAAHDRGTPCADMKCSECGASMVGATADTNKKAGVLQRLTRKISSMFANELSHQDINTELTGLVRAQVSLGIMDYVWVREVFDKEFIYEIDTNAQGLTLFRQAYAIAADEKVMLVGDAVAVKEVIEFVPVTENSAGDDNKGTPNQGVAINKGGPVMDRKQKVDALIANSESGWVEGDRQFLMDIKEDDRFEKVVGNVVEAPAPDAVPAATAPAAAAVAAPAAAAVAAHADATAAPAADVVPAADPEAPKVQTLDDLVQNASPAMRESIEEAVAHRDAAHADLVTRLAANTACPHDEAALKGMALQTLKEFAQMCKLDGDSDDGGLVNYRMQAPDVNASGETEVGGPAPAPKLSFNKDGSSKVEEPVAATV